MYKGWFVEWIEEWSQFVDSCNWYTFHPVFMEFEDDRSMGGVEFTVIILGFGFRIRWNYKVTEQVESVINQVNEITGGGDAKTK